jgi:hypothetical protein
MKKLLDEEEEDEFRIGSLPLQIPNYDRTESETPLVHTPNIPDQVQQMVETPLLERDDQNYTPKNPRSSREIQPTRTAPLVTRSRARIMSQEE